MTQVGSAGPTGHMLKFARSAGDGEKLRLLNGSGTTFPARGVYVGDILVQAPFGDLATTIDASLVGAAMLGPTGMLGTVQPTPSNLGGTITGVTHARQVFAKVFVVLPAASSAVKAEAGMQTAAITGHPTFTTVSTKERQPGQTTALAAVGEDVRVTAGPCVCLARITLTSVGTLAAGTPLTVWGATPNTLTDAINSPVGTRIVGRLLQTLGASVAHTTGTVALGLIEFDGEHGFGTTVDIT